MMTEERLDQLKGLACDDDWGRLIECIQEIERLRAAIRRHRDQRGDDRCWMDDEELYKVLPEGYTPPVRDTTVELSRCQQFIACRHNPATTYVSPQRRIEELELAYAVLTKAFDNLQESVRGEW